MEFEDDFFNCEKSKRNVNSYGTHTLYFGGYNIYFYKLLPEYKSGNTRQHIQIKKSDQNKKRNPKYIYHKQQQRKNSSTHNRYS